MKTYIAKIVVVIIIFSMTVASVTGFIAINRSTEYMETEIQEKILTTSEKYANDFSAQFNHMEGLTDSLYSYVSTRFDTDQYRADPESYLDSFEEELAEVICHDLKSVRNAHSLYVTFNPELTAVGREVWFIMNDGKLEEVDVPAEQLERDFTLPYDDDMAYFFEPQGKDKGIWIPPYVDEDIDKEVFSYSRAIYVEDVFIGVAGADIAADDIVSTVESMSLYSGGYSVLLDNDHNVIIEPDHVDGEEKKLMTEGLAKNPRASAGITQYEYEGEENIMAYCRMDNGWTMAIIQPKGSAYRSTYQLTKAFKVLAVILGIVLVAFLYGFSWPFIKKQTALEKENREKDLMLMYQSRHAKIGEMFGNITHQWKQPLNSINLIMANLLDSYRYDDLNEARLEKSVAKVASIVDKMSETITDFSDFLKPAKEKAAFDVSDCIESAVSLMEESINNNKIDVKVTCGTHEKVYGYFNEMVHVIFNLLNNARDAIVLSDADCRTIYVATEYEHCSVKISIRNYGDRIPEEMMGKVFDPYFTTKEEVGGTGLGLFISRRIIEERMGGRLHMENLDDGVMCRIVVPAADEEVKE